MRMRAQSYLVLAPLLLLALQMYWRFGSLPPVQSDARSDALIARLQKLNDETQRIGTAADAIIKAAAPTGQPIVNPAVRGAAIMPAAAAAAAAGAGAAAAATAAAAAAAAVAEREQHLESIAKAAARVDAHARAAAAAAAAAGGGSAVVQAAKAVVDAPAAAAGEPASPLPPSNGVGAGDGGAAPPGPPPRAPGPRRDELSCAAFTSAAALAEHVVPDYFAALRRDWRGSVSARAARAAAHDRSKAAHPVSIFAQYETLRDHAAHFVVRRVPAPRDAPALREALLSAALRFAPRIDAEFCAKLEEQTGAFAKVQRSVPGGCLVLASATAMRSADPFADPPAAAATATATATATAKAAEIKAAWARVDEGLPGVEEELPSSSEEGDWAVRRSAAARAAVWRLGGLDYGDHSRLRATCSLHGRKHAPRVGLAPSVWRAGGRGGPTARGADRGGPGALLRPPLLAYSKGAVKVSAEGQVHAADGSEMLVQFGGCYHVNFAKVENCRERNEYSSAHVAHAKLPVGASVLVLSQVMGNAVYHVLIEAIPRMLFLLPELTKHAHVKVHVVAVDVDSAGKDGVVPAVTRNALAFYGIGPERVVTGPLEATEVFVPQEVLCGLPGFGANFWMMNAAREATTERLPAAVAKRLGVAVDAPAARGAYAPAPGEIVVIHRARGQRESAKMHNHKQLLALVSKVFGVPVVRATLATAMEAPPPSAAGKIVWRILEFSDEEEALLRCYTCVLAIFRRARIVVGKHGAGLSNMLVSAPNSAVLEIWDNFNPPCFLDLAHTLGLEHHMLVSDNGGAPLRKVRSRLVELKGRYEGAEAAYKPAAGESPESLRRVRQPGALEDDPPRYEQVYALRDKQAMELADNAGAGADKLNELKARHQQELATLLAKLAAARAENSEDVLGAAAKMEAGLGLGGPIVLGGGAAQTASVAATAAVSPPVVEKAAAVTATAALADPASMKLSAKAAECLARSRQTASGNAQNLASVGDATRWAALRCNIFGGAFSAKAVAQDKIAPEAVDEVIAPFKAAGKAGLPPLWGVGQTAVVGLAAGNFDLHTARRFVGTLRMAGYCDTIIWGVTDELDPEARAFLLENQVILSDVKVGPCASEDFGKKCSATDNKVPLALYRFEWYKEQLDYLQKELGVKDTGHVLFSDSRDAFFQANPFHNSAHPAAALSLAPGQDLGVFLEHDAIPIDDQGINRGWIDSCWGQTGLDRVFNGRKVRENQVSCSGTSMGTVAGLRRYLGLMLAEMKAKGCKDYGIDQVSRRSLSRPLFPLCDRPALAHPMLCPRRRRAGVSQLHAALWTTGRCQEGAQARAGHRPGEHCGADLRPRDSAAARRTGFCPQPRWQVSHAPLLLSGC